jgi:hypothetical protein
MCRGGHQRGVKTLKGGVVPKVIQNDPLVGCFLAVRHYRGGGQNRDKSTRYGPMIVKQLSDEKNATEENGCP